MKWLKSYNFFTDILTEDFGKRHVSVKFNSKLPTQGQEDKYLPVASNCPVYAETNQNFLQCLNGFSIKKREREREKRRKKEKSMSSM